MAQQEAILVGKWHMAYHHADGVNILKLEFADREPVYLAFPPQQAQEIANAFLENLKTPPPKRGQMN
jgi:hypothetical protein